MKIAAEEPYITLESFYFLQSVCTDLPIPNRLRMIEEFSQEQKILALLVLFSVDGSI